jgi:hypothetical protein
MKFGTRFFRVFLSIFLLFAVPVTFLTAQIWGSGSSLRFYGNGVGDIDRVKIRIDDPAPALSLAGIIIG